jgi:hypothetical protein
VQVGGWAERTAQGYRRFAAGQAASSSANALAYADTEGQSEPVFGLCRLLGIKLMPRMRQVHRWLIRGIPSDGSSTELKRGLVFACCARSFPPWRESRAEGGTLRF